MKKYATEMYLSVRSQDKSLCKGMPKKENEYRYLSLDIKPIGKDNLKR